MVTPFRRHSFAARCPNGHRPAQMQTLADLKSPFVRFHCGVCQRDWAPKSDDVARAVGFAEAAEDVEGRTPPAAA